MATAAQQKAADEKAAKDKAAGSTDPAAATKSDGAPKNTENVTDRATGSPDVTNTREVAEADEAAAEAAESNPDGLPYQTGAAVEQARNELANARAYGQTTLASAAEKRLRALGAEVPAEGSEDDGPRGRRTASKSTTKQD